VSISIKNKQGKQMTPEAKVKASVVKILKDYGVYYFFPATHGYGRSGVPDIICCYMGAFIAIECKTIKGKLTALQERELLRIRRAGGQSFMVNEDLLDDLKLYFASFDEDGRG
jgi:Holliday junction resolvase